MPLVYGIIYAIGASLTAAAAVVAWRRHRAPGGLALYFSGYLDRHVNEDDPFRVYRIERSGQGMRELLRGERVSAGCRAASAGPA